MSIGETIKTKRRSLGLTLRELSEMIGVHINTVHFWEYNMQNPSLKNAKKLRNILGGDLVDYIDLQ